MSHRIADWFAGFSREIEGDYERLYAAALDDPQRAGHGGEATWAKLLEKWLPGSYEVDTRKYIVPEVEDAPEPRETDIVVYNPGYPAAFRGREEVLAGGLAAAFNVRLTLRADGIKDATERAVEARRYLKTRYGAVRGELLGPFSVGLLAHSHHWKSEGSTPVENISGALLARDEELARHPRESLDFICVADLATWVTSRATWLPWDPPVTLSTMIQAHPGLSPAPIASFFTHLLRRLSYFDPMLRPMAQGLFELGLMGIGGGNTRSWDPRSVFDEEVLEQLPNRLDRSDPSWLYIYY